MNNEFKRMQKLAGLITENMVNEESNELKKIAGEVFDHFKDMESSDSNERLEYIKTKYKLAGDDAETVHSLVSRLMRDLGDFGDVEEGMGAYEYEKGKEAGEKIEKEKMSKSKLRSKIREMILAELDGAAVEAEDYDPVAEAKKKDEEEEDIDVEDVDVDIDTETPDMEMGSGDAEVDHIQSLLNQLQDAAEQLGDEKLLKQVGNTITFFTRQHVAEKPELNEMLSSDYIDRMEGLANVRYLSSLKLALSVLALDWMNEGFDKEDVVAYIESLINKI